MAERTAAQRLMTLFEGHAGAHGTHGEPVQSGLKWAIKTTARTVHEPVTLQLWEQHLEGTSPLGVIPIMEDSTCLWGSIDIDVYDADLLGVVERVQAAKMPLVPGRSKSGGLHLFIFLSDPQPAALLRNVLRDLAARLGLAKKSDGTTDTEIFPVQSQVLTERGDVGNWMVMPYFGSTYGGKLREQAGLKKTGAEQTVEEFLNLAERLRLADAAFEALAAQKAPRERGRMNGRGPAPSEPFGDGPVCLEHMVAEGNQLTDGRKRTLFMMGLYFKRADPKNWKSRLEEANGLFFNPPLPSEEVVGVNRQLSKKEYEYTCKVEPMSVHCDARRCRLRSHGVGGGGLFPAITGLSKLDTDPPLWFLDVDDLRVEASTEQLLNYRAMMELFASRGNRVFRLMSQKDWIESLIGPMDAVVLLEAPPDAGPGAKFHEVLEDYLVNRWRGQSPDDLLRDKPWEDADGTHSDGDPRHYFKLKWLEARLLKEGLRDITRGQIINHVQKLGGGKKQMWVKETNLALWWVPSSAVRATPRLDVPQPKGEAM